MTRVILRLGVGAALAACGANYYDKAPPMEPKAPPPRAEKTEAPMPPFTLGKGAPDDVEQAAKSLYAACGNGDATACNQVGQLAASRNWGAKNAAQAAMLFDRACEGGSAAGCENLAEALEAGDGVPVDMPKAWALHERACQGKRGYSCMKLGVRYAIGQGDAPRDFHRAKDYLAHACEEGDSGACQLTVLVTACQARTDPEACNKLDAMKARLDSAESPVPRTSTNANDAGR